MKQILAIVLAVVLGDAAGLGAPDSSAEKEQQEAVQRALRDFYVGPSGATVAYAPPSNGITLGLELARTSIVAGERLTATMIVSNGSTATVGLSTERSGRTDTEIGNFVVMDESGNILPRTLPKYYQMSTMGSKGNHLDPGEAVAFSGDVVWCYALTNPGNYLVKAMPHLPLTNDTGRFETFQGETPPIAITVLPRPEGSPPLGDLYTAHLNPEQLERFNDLEAIVKARREKAQAPHAVAPRARSALPPQVQAVAGAETAPDALGPVADQPAASATRSKNVYYGLAVLLLVGGVIFFIWRSRRSQHP